MKKLKWKALNRFLRDEQRAAAILMNCAAGVVLVSVIVAVLAIAFLR